ncbi:MAG: ABC-F family ATP-binding cassette domain-containing protein [Clostridia bacterium]|nr:ABC-F family ATP-binding cassette domain-containing protein [Clostridia bacterium]
MLDIKNLTHGFEDRTLYKNVNIKINKGNKIGLVGANGTGKTTLINILTGKIICDEGSLEWEKNYNVGYLDQHLSLDKKLTIKQYLESAFSKLKEIETEYNAVNERFATAMEAEMEELARKSASLFEYLDSHNYYAIDSTINKVASGLGVMALGLDTPLGKLSGGQQAKVILCKLLLEEPDILILDEPTNHLDTAHIEWLKEYLKGWKGSFLIVSHDTVFLDAVCNTIWSVENKSIVRYNGNYTAFLRQQAEKNLVLDRTIKKQEQKIEKLQDFIARNSARTATARQAQSRAKQLEKMEIIEKGEQVIEPKYKFLYTPLSAHTVLKAENLSIGYSFPLISGINLEIHNGEKWRIMGFNGIGKTTLLKTLLGEILPLKGKVTKHHLLKIGYFEQEIAWGMPHLTPIEEMRNEFPKLDDKQLRSSLAKAGLSSKHQMQPLCRLSGGEQSKVKLAKFMLEQFNMVILDEPTNHLDPLCKRALAKAINEYRGTLIFVSHEEDFAQNIACKELDLSKLKK